MSEYIIIYTIGSLIVLFGLSLPLKFLLIVKRAFLMLMGTGNKIFSSKKQYSFKK